MTNTRQKQNNLPSEYDYVYSCSRIRAMESRLLNSGETLRLFESESPEDIAKMLADRGMVISEDVEKSVQIDLEQDIGLILSLTPDQRYIEPWLLQNDYHNTKVLLKALIPPDQAQILSADSQQDITQMIEKRREEISLTDLDYAFARPSMMTPEMLFQAITDPALKHTGGAIFEAIPQAYEEYIRTRDPGAIDRIMDYDYHLNFRKQARAMNNLFMNRFYDMKADLANLSVLLRVRAMDAQGDALKANMIPPGRLTEGMIFASHKAPATDIRRLMDDNGYGDLSAYAEAYGESKAVMLFGKASDDCLSALVRRTKTVLFGPEILFAFIYFKKIQLQNIRIALTCIRNGLSAAFGADLMRQPMA